MLFRSIVRLFRQRRDCIEPQVTEHCNRRRRHHAAERADVEWLARIYGFIQHVDKHVQKASGTLVKRMGDGLLISFSDVQAAELFLHNLKDDPDSASYPYKASADFGNVFYFRFEEQLNDDPYGTVVDRCARLLEKSQQGVVLCSSSLFEASSNKDSFHSAGKFGLKGLPQPEEIFFWFGNSTIEPESYLGPLIKILNAEKNQQPGYRYISRVFSTNDFKMPKSDARPFLIRELLNVPKLPFSYAEFRKLLKTVKNNDDLTMYYGMFVEWEAIFYAYDRIHDDLILAHLYPEDHDGRNIIVHMPLFMVDVLREFSEGDKLHLRGIISEIGGLAIHINYADIGTPEPDSSAAVEK